MKTLRGLGLVVFSLVLMGFVGLSQADWRVRKVDIINNSSSDMIGLYASQVGIKDWQENMLGSRYLPSGYHISANIDDGSTACQYDLKAVMNDGREAYKYNVDVCAVTSWTVHD
jgi:hypothetical protein